jgi:hypothetical protein
MEASSISITALAVSAISVLIAFFALRWARRNALAQEGLVDAARRQEIEAKQQARTEYWKRVGQHAPRFELRHAFYEDGTLRCWFQNSGDADGIFVSAELEASFVSGVDGDGPERNLPVAPGTAMPVTFRGRKNLERLMYGDNGLQVDLAYRSAEDAYRAGATWRLDPEEYTTRPTRWRAAEIAPKPRRLDCPSDH